MTDGTETIAPDAARPPETLPQDIVMAFRDNAASMLAQAKPRAACPPQPVPA